MAQIKVVGKSLTLTSTVALADIKSAAKRYPNALVLTETNEKTGEVKELFRAFVGKTGDIGSGKLSAVVFDNADKSGKARASILINAPEKADVTEYVKDTYGNTLTLLGQWESAFAGSKKAFDEAYAELGKNISVE